MHLLGRVDFSGTVAEIIGVAKENSVTCTFQVSTGKHLSSSEFRWPCALRHWTTSDSRGIGPIARGLRPWRWHAVRRFHVGPSSL